MDIDFYTGVSSDVDEYRSRFMGASWFEDVKGLSVMIIGCGGIGSHAALQVSRLGIERIKFIDMDTVSAENMSGQLFYSGCIGRSKIDCCVEIAETYSGTTLTSGYRMTAEEYFSRTMQVDSDIVILALDSITARKSVIEALSFRNYNGYIIDARLGFNDMQVFTVKVKRGTPEYEIYSTYALFNQSEAEELVCTMKQTTYMAAICGGFIANVIPHITLSVKYEKNFVPFEIEYSGISMMAKRVTAEEFKSAKLNQKKKEEEEDV